MITVKMSQWFPLLVQFQKPTNSQNITTCLLKNISSNEMKEVDDFNPRACLKPAVKNKEINIEDSGSI